MTDKQWNPEDYLLDFPDVLAYEGPLTGMPIHHKVLKVKTFLEVVPKVPFLKTSRYCWRT